MIHGLAQYKFQFSNEAGRLQNPTESGLENQSQKFGSAWAFAVLRLFLITFNVSEITGRHYLFGGEFDNETKK